MKIIKDISELKEDHYYDIYWFNNNYYIMKVVLLEHELQKIEYTLPYNDDKKYSLGKEHLKHLRHFDFLNKALNKKNIRFSWVNHFMKMKHKDTYIKLFNI